MTYFRGDAHLRTTYTQNRKQMEPVPFRYYRKAQIVQSVDRYIDVTSLSIKLYVNVYLHMI
jgi:hypothetical protein